MKKFTQRLVSLLTAISILAVWGAVASVTAEEEFYATASMVDGEIKVEFSGLPEEIGLSDISVINTETGEGLSLSSPYYLSKTMVIPVNEEIQPTVEYCVILPEDMKSLDGALISDSYVYFVTPMDRENTQKVVIVNDTFDDYVKNGVLPPEWYGRMQGNFNDFNIYSDDEHDKAFQMGMNGLVQILNTRNFGKAIDYKFKLEFDYKQTAMNKYIKGEEDPNLVQAVYDSAKSKQAGLNSVDQLNQNMRLVLAPVAEDGKIRTDSKGNNLNEAGFLPTAGRGWVSNDKVIYPDAVFQLYGDRLGFGNGILPSEGNYVRIEKDKWYHIELDFDMEQFEVTAYIDGEQIGPHPLPACYKDAQHGAVAARASFFVENPVKFEIADGSVTYIDSETGEEKTFSHVNDSHFAIDNFKVTNEEPEFKPVKSRMISVKGEKFPPIRQIGAIINKIEIGFTSSVDTSSVSSGSLTVTDNDGKVYPYTVTGYDEKNYTVELTFDKFLSPNREYTVSVSGVKSTIGAVSADYTTDFCLGNGYGLYIGEIKALDGNKNVITGSVNAMTVAFFDGYMAEIAGQERNVNLVLGAYSSDENGEAMVAQKSKTVTLKSAEKTVTVLSPDMVMLMITKAADSVKGFAYEIDNFTESDIPVNVKSFENSGEIWGTAEPNEEIIIDIPADKTAYETDKNSTMLYRNKITADDNGKYSTKLSTADFTAGEYAVYVYATKSKKSFEGKLVHSTETSIKTAVLAINSSDDKEAALKEQRLNLGIDTELCENGSNERVAEMLGEYGALPESGEAKSVLEKMYVISGVESGKTENLFEYADILKIGESDLSGWQEKTYVTQAFEKGVTAKLKGKKFKTVNDFYDELAEQFVLSVVALKDGYGNAEEIIKAFESKIGVDADALTESAYRKTAGNVYSAYKELKDALEENNQSPSGSGGSGGGGGGGGSASGGGKPSNVTLPVEDKDTEKPALLYNIFADIENIEWAKPAIVYLTEMGIINGTSKTTFSPNNYITREEMAKILVNAYLPDAKEEDVPFADADKNAWYYPYVAKAYSSGVVKGYDNNSFGVGDYITRQDLAVMVYNASVTAGEKYSQSSEPIFDDDAEISDYAKTAVYALKGVNAINGVDGSNFSPKGRATRAEAAKIIYSLLKL